MNYKDIILIKDNELNILYHANSMDISILNDNAYSTLEQIKRETTCNTMGEYAKSLLENENKGIDNLINLLEQSSENSISDINKSSRIIERITLHVSNDCNLRCKYCYANGGSYNQTRRLMTLETANSFINFCEKNFNYVKRIVFFGGEPILNLNIMEYICKRFNDDFHSNKISFIPEFAIITNGTILTDRIIEFINKYISIITVSIDGLKDINDANRIDKNGKGSFDRISRFIQTIKNQTKVTLKFEATYTQKHIDFGYRTMDISKDLKNTFGISGLVVTEDTLSTDFSLKYLDTIDYSKLISSNFEDLPEEFWAILKIITTKERLKYCGVVEKIFAISAEGEIYPCHILTGQSNISLGNINGNNIFNNFAWFQEFMEDMRKRESIKCKDCWCRNLCCGCILKRFYNKKTQKFREEPNSDFCDFIQKYSEKILLMIAKIRKNPETWSALIQKERENSYLF